MKNIKVLKAQKRNKKVFVIQEYRKILFFNMFVSTMSIYPISEEHIIHEIEEQKIKYYTLKNIKFPFFDSLVFNKNLTSVKILNKKKSKELITESNNTTEDNLNSLQIFE